MGFPLIQLERLLKTATSQVDKSGKYWNCFLVKAVIQIQFLILWCNGKGNRKTIGEFTA